MREERKSIFLFLFIYGVKQDVHTYPINPMEFNTTSPLINLNLTHLLTINPQTHIKSELAGYNSNFDYVG